ncbi:MAG: twin-arginine translocase TatA/TatE family subunit [Anaerolineae bacterium]|nr:twin-arginine translocase TatA/TatE family subunit [Anaerolineae bacterium]
MNGFFNIGTGELMIIIVIAILVIGPKRMLELGQAIGRLTQQGRRIWGEVMKTIQTELQDTKEAVEEIAAGGSNLAAEVKATGQETGKALQKSKAETFDMKTELEEIGRETQQVMKEVTEGFASIITGKADLEKTTAGGGDLTAKEIKTTSQKTDKALQKSQAETFDTQQVVTGVTEEFASIIAGKAEPKEDQDEKAEDKEASQE